MSRPGRKAEELEDIGARELAQGRYSVAADFFIAAATRFTAGGHMDGAERCTRLAASALDRHADEICRHADRDREHRRRAAHERTQ